VTVRKPRELCGDPGLEEGGGRAGPVGRLDRFYRGEGAHDDAPVTFPRRELESMTAAQLRTVCEDMGLPAGGRKAAMAARVLAAQGEQPGQRGRDDPGGGPSRAAARP
jgi:hypothetical protein